jgi:hypothetical protein
MKKSAIAVLLLFFTISAFSQINVDEYERKAKANIDNLDEISAVNATSECGEVKVEIEDKQFSGGCLGTLVRTYKFTDDCGNEAKAEKYISLMDTEAPVFNDVPENMAISSAEEIPAAPELTATDNSGKPVKITMEEIDKKKTIIRKWTATDPCGNSTTEQQEITWKGV